MKKFYLSLVILALSIISLSTGPTAQLQSVDVDQPEIVSTTLVLSQVYGGGGGSTGTYIYDYVEIKNISNVTQSLTGLSLVYGSATGNFAAASDSRQSRLYPDSFTWCS